MPLTVARRLNLFYGDRGAQSPSWARYFIRGQCVTPAGPCPAPASCFLSAPSGQRKGSGAATRARRAPAPGEPTTVACHGRSNHLPRPLCLGKSAAPLTKSKRAGQQCLRHMRGHVRLRRVAKRTFANGMLSICLSGSAQKIDVRTAPWAKPSTPLKALKSARRERAVPTRRRFFVNLSRLSKKSLPSAGRFALLRAL